MRVIRLVVLGIVAAAALGFAIRLLAPRRPVGAGEVSYQAPTPADDTHVTVDRAAPL